MKILFISSSVLFKDTRFGGVKRLYYFARQLQKDHQLYCICVDGCRECSGVAPGNRFEHFLFVPLDRPQNYLHRMTTCPIDITRQIASHRDTIRDFIGDERRFDVVYCAYPLALSFLGTAIADDHPNIVYSEDDFVVDILKNEMLQQGNIMRRAVKGIRYFQTVRYMRKKLCSVRKMIVISEQEKRVAKRLFPWTEQYVIKYALEKEEYPLLPMPRGNVTLGFIGNFDHHPNRTAVEYFLSRIYPLCRESFPGIQFIIAGKAIPGRYIDFYSTDRSIHFMENVPRLRDFYKKIHVFVNPVISQRGLRTKLIEVAAFGRPIISTPLGAEGLEDFEITIAETADDYINACNKYRDKREYRRCVRHNRSIFEQSYTVETIGKQLEEVFNG
jgi:glycosyltransferase involved in cell wall biosynthesis